MAEPNRRQLRVLGVAALAWIVLCSLVVPWRWFEADGRAAEFAGYAPAWRPPATLARDRSGERFGYAVIPPRRQLRVDRAILAVELGATALLAAGLLLALRTRR